MQMIVLHTEFVRFSTDSLADFRRYFYYCTWALRLAIDASYSLLRQKLYNLKLWDCKVF